ncbi:MAG: DUF2330 domain-containing protein [Deinococcota bacterium]
MKHLFIGLIFCVLGSAQAFCGFYVGKADSQLFNEASKVIIARDGNRTVLSMANDYRGEVNEFALVVPIPYVFEESQIQVGSASIFDRIDAYSAPRLVEYFDEDPCWMRDRERMFDILPSAPTMESAAPSTGDALGVTVEASFSVGEYDILILSAEESNGLETWLLQNDYNIPTGATEIFNRYIAMGMNFFVARVNLDEFESSGNVFLRPLVMAFESDELMLPIKLGTVNAAGKQDLVVFLLSPEGRIVTDNYRMVNIPSDVNLPEYVDENFADFYVSMFQTVSEREQEGRGVAFLEYAWDMSWCDPCAADPLSNDELRQAGVFWNVDNSGGAPNVYLTRLHLRYDSESHPEDLQFRVTNTRDNFQGRYILQRPFDGVITCEEGEQYVRSVLERQQRESQQLANLTGWELAEIQANITPYNPEVDFPEWWETLFDRFR